MKHHCHCGLEKHFQHFRVKKLGLAGVIFMGLHILFHVVECLILPSILVTFGGHLAEEPAQAADPAVMAEADLPSASELSRPKICFAHNSSLFQSVYWHTPDGGLLLTPIGQPPCE